MAPRTRSTVQREKLELVNRHGLSGLPIELLLRIVSFTHAPIIPWLRQRPFPTQYRERRVLLRALCQVCHSLRLALFPILWERVEACTIHPEHKDEDDKALPKSLANELSSQLKVIAMRQHPSAACVRIVNVAIEPETAETVLGELAQSLTLLPNLRTLQIVCRSFGRMLHSKMKKWSTRHGEEAREVFEQAFSGRSYPSVRRLSLPSEARDILVCFPEVLDVCLNQPLFVSFLLFIDSLARHCPKVESFGWYESAADIRVAQVVGKLPNLRQVRCCEFIDVNLIKQLAKLQRLDTFSLHVTGEELSQREVNTIEAAKKLLASLPHFNGRLELIFPSRIEHIIVQGGQ